MKNHPFFEEQDILVEEELPIAEDILEENTDPNPTDNPLIPEVQEYAGNSVPGHKVRFKVPKCNTIYKIATEKEQTDKNSM